MATEISRIAEKVNNTRGFVYELRVNSPGTYVNVRGVPTQMNAGDVWKYGETTKGFGRYSQSTPNWGESDGQNGAGGLVTYFQTLKIIAKTKKCTFEHECNTVHGI